MREMCVVAIVGPESTGKTTLAKQLASGLGGAWLPEYARSYLDWAEYTETDLLHITEEQLQRESDFISSEPNIAVLDTDGIVLRIWWEEKYGKVPRLLEHHLVNQMPRFYLLTKPDIPWEFDPRRESPSELDRLFDRYENLLLQRHFSYGLVEGSGESRTRSAFDHLDRLGLK